MRFGNRRPFYGGEDVNRNKCLRFWMDSTKEDQVNYGTLCRLTTELSNSPEFSFVGKLNSMARQASAERAWFSISRFYNNCQRGLAKKGYPKFKKFSRSVEYKTSGWKLTEDKKFIRLLPLRMGENKCFNNG